MDIFEPFHRIKAGCLKRYYRAKYGTSAFIVSYMGARLLVRLDDAVGKSIALGRFETSLLKAFLSHAKAFQPDCFYDVGANIGLYSFMLAHHIPTLHIEAFEPDPINFEYLRANLLINQAGQKVSLHAHAVGAQANTLPLKMRHEGNSGLSHIARGNEGNADIVQVPVKPLDEIIDVRGKRLLFKIDVEGFEGDVLAGMRQTLANNHCLLQIEVRAENRQEICELLAASGYQQLADYGEDLLFGRKAG